MAARPTYERTLNESQLLSHLPNEIAELIRTASGTQYLNALAVGALRSSYTENFFYIYEPIFVDLAARWLISDLHTDKIDILSAFSRILPFAPYLQSFASQYATSRAGPLSALASDEPSPLQLDDTTLRTLLIAISRLISHDLEAFSNAISPSRLQTLFQHRDLSIRYLAIRCFALYMRAADAATEAMIQKYLADDIVEGEWEGIVIDYRCLGLWEERRWNKLEKTIRSCRANRSHVESMSQVEKLREYFTVRTAEVCGVLIPRLNDPSPSTTSIVKTPTAVGNLRKIATSLAVSKPLLLVGLPNSGKTTLVNDVAATMGQLESMVTLHLNEQTDAKSLLGMYSTSPATGTFSWQPGVLTKAAREGRWILIEDLDRAPSEVIGLILPIIERGELTIASRKERVKCAEGFRIIATMKSSYNIAGEEIAPNATVLGSRLWQRVQIDSLSIDEIREVVAHKFPLLESRVPIIMNVYQRLCSSFHGSLAIKSSQGRTPGLRDLIKLCSRMHRRLQRLGAKTGYEATPEGADDEIFLDFVDIFLSYVPEKSLLNSLALVVAEALQISPQRARFCLHERTPAYSDQGNNLVLGREMCRKIKVPSGSASKSASASSRFASTRAALKLMEQVAAAVQMAEPVLLIGETGIGKTTVIQQLATMMRQKLTVVNLSQQSESTDLLGGFKPVNIRTMAVPMLDEFNTVFELTFSAKKNQKFLSSVAKSVSSGNWVRLVNLWHEAVRLADGVFKSKQGSSQAGGEEEQPSKKRKLDSPKYQHLRQRWERFASQLNDFEAQVSQGDAKFAFAFVQGKIVRALRNGEWVLLDEVNLASPDTLENIASLLHHGSEGSPSVLLSEAGDVERVFGHPDFRIFGAMNPATDAGKKDLPPGLRSRFTELYVQSPDTDLDDLLALIQKYLGDLSLGDSRIVPDLAQLYMATKKLSNENQLTDGAGQRPHFSIRTLVRALVYVTDHAHIYGLRRAIFEGFSMSFLTVLSQESEKLLMPLLETQLFSNAKNARALLGQTPRPPNDGHEYVQFKHYWMRRGRLVPEEQPHYIITPFIEKNLKNLVRASSTRRFPVLLQGPTSAGKTSMIEFLAKVSGNKFVRINNHEHTDLQEYLGSYVSGDDGTLRYQEGVLVEALRNGYWIVLDELNLAPSDVLEAMNRLLDDNRELFIPETQEVVRPHPNFMLFATQNPAGLYGGRKVLSRAFRNRFLELHFDDIPESELEFILKERSQIAPSFCTRIVAVYRKLSLLRQANRLFEQKNSFATLRDLFRWALRRADDREQLAINGFMLLAERVRNPQERTAVKSVIEEVMKVRIDEEVIYSSSELEKRAPQLQELTPGIVWTSAMRRLFILVSVAIENNEPVLLVGETGCGKTQLCQAVAEAYHKQLLIVNAHVNLETGDLIGAQRPVRNRAAIESQLVDDLRTALPEDSAESKSIEELRHAFGALTAEQAQNLDLNLVQSIEKNISRLNALFEWSDGSLITAMKTGQFFLLDEISLADDSVLERLNSVLEPHRSILLAEKGPIDSMVVADEGFQFLSTMNPGGDYGKRELSAALRNRMTEIWAPQLSEDDDILPILHRKLAFSSEDTPRGMLQFAKWFKWTFQSTSATSLSIRDLLAWVDFVNKCGAADLLFAIVQGAAMVFVDTLGANPAAMLATSLHNLEGNRKLCLDKLHEIFSVDAAGIYLQKSAIDVEGSSLCVGPFALPMNVDSMPDPQFIMDAPTTIANSVRIARGLQLPKPILLEGSPGVGKTTLVTALAKALGKPLTRINLSDQTDLTDLFGSDVPVEGGDVGQFTWRDAPFLQAMQRGDWVLLDEMNLASQSVLEGLNACLDHRQMVYVAELDQTFRRHPDFVLFAAQNPHHQGGGRKGLPASFVNRFTVVYADSFTNTDLKRICSKLFPGSPTAQTDRLVDFVSLLNRAIVQERRLGAVGGPWELNLRDIQRWLQLADRETVQVSAHNFLDVIISQRFRSQEDRDIVSHLYKQVFNDGPDFAKSYYHNLTPDYMQVGLGMMERDPLVQQTMESRMKILPQDLSILESLMLCIEQSWPSILVGPSGCGKTTLIRKLAALNGASLIELALSADTDTMDLIGGFEQMDHKRDVSSLLQEVSMFLRRHVISTSSSHHLSDEELQFLHVFETLHSANASLDMVYSSMMNLYHIQPHENLEKLIKRAEHLLEVSKHSDAMKVGFEWTEGVLTQAVQHGHWVILDNANLCNPSVLDRLNSLTEPNGALILNEQRTEDGSARIVKPHPNFRLFLTMDSRHGELSRAMRNRCVEICFLSQGSDSVPDTSVPAYTSESFLYRLRPVWNIESMSTTEPVSGRLYEVGFDHLSIQDLAYLQRSQKYLLPYLTSPAEETLSSVLDRVVSVAHDVSSLKPFECTKKAVTLGSSPLSIRGFLQPLHPLVNEPLLSILENDVSAAALAILANIQESDTDLHRLKMGLLQADESGKLLKPSQMSRLERSLASTRTPALMKDSTQPVASFLSDCAQAVYDCIMNLDASVLGAPQFIVAIRAVLSFCGDIFRLTSSTELDEGEFQVYLEIGKELAAFVSDSWAPLKPLAITLTQALSRFQENWALKTGLSMQKLWESWRPVTPATQEQLKSVLALERVALEFTRIATKTHLHLAQLSQVRNSLVNAQRIILLEGADEEHLVQSLKQTVDELTSLVQRPGSTDSPYFANEFEVLCQYHDLASLTQQKEDSQVIRSILPLLAGRSARPLNTSNLQNRVPEVLHKLSLFSGSESPSLPTSAVNDTLSLALLDKLVSIGKTHLGQMDALEVEKQNLSKALALTSHEISMDQLKVLRQVLSSITMDLLVIHRELLDEESFANMVSVLETIEKQGSRTGPMKQDSKIAGNLPGDHYFKPFAEKALPSLIDSLSTESGHEGTVDDTGSALVKLAVILLRLFVPDKPFDPSLSLVVQRERHSQRVKELTEKSEALASFEMNFSGHSYNLRQKIVQSDLENLGSAPPPSSVTRPQDSEMGLLNAEFSSLVKSVLDRHPEDMLGDASSPEWQRIIGLLRDNVRQLSQRLAQNYRSYDDITIPVVRFLQILDLGLSMASSKAQNSRAAHLLKISERTPFLGGRIHPVPASLHGSLETNTKDAIQMGLHEMSSLTVAQSADQGILRTEGARDALRQLFEQFHTLWKAKLREDQEEEAQKSQFYHYRGSWEDSEEVDENELRQLFPTYDEEAAEEEPKSSNIDPKAIAVRLASLHSRLFQPGDHGKALSAYVKESATLLGSIWSESSHSISRIHPKEHLSGILLVLEDAVNNETNSANKYNFYTDTNLDAARKLVSLTQSTQARFYEIQKAWPDHAVLADVIQCCDEIYQFKHSEPVAKFLTKVEKLHALVHEWQLVASREYSAASNYDAITGLIISWRRLELSTWAKLLDLEKEKCEHEVASWWFVAYEAVIKAPLQLAECDEELGDHIREVIATLEKFFQSTTMGQYNKRLQLIRDFRSLLLLYVPGLPSLSQLSSALDNFIRHYEQFEPPIEKILKEKRSALEKDIKEQIQLASWKDTNILALRESARRSHYKLFKMVRKYRAALAQPAQPLLEQDMPDANDGLPLTNDVLILPSASIPESLAACQQDESIWLNRPPRFRDPDGTSNNMMNMYMSLPTEFDVSKDLEGFVKYFIETITEFKSQTPKVLTEENKDDVQHLKIQKKRFYADTLRQIFEMGIKRSTSTNLLELQADVSQVLATSASLDVHGVMPNIAKSSDLYFHRFLDLLPRVRQAAINYSEELSNVEISRSSGSVEHLLAMVRKQRGVIAPALSDLGSLQSTLEKISNLWSSGPTSVFKSHPNFKEETQDVIRTVAWLAPILGLASRIVGIHAEFSGINASHISDGLRSWKDTFDGLRKSLAALPELPECVASQLHRTTREEATSSLERLKSDVSVWVQRRPDLSFVLEQINPWVNTEMGPDEWSEADDGLAVSEFDDTLITAIDKILISMQKLKEVPSLVASPGSLARSDEFFMRAIKAIHLPDVTASIREVLDMMQALESRSGSGISLAVALLVSLLPVMNKYHRICQDIINRFLVVHRETCKTSYILAKTFTQIASEGYCSPAEASNEGGQSGDLESGTGLGDGEGAEDISKDVGDDEDLTELAQEPNEQPKEDMENSADAVDMDQEDMEGQEGERKEDNEEEKDEDGSEDEDEPDIDEEVGSVDDLDPSAVDEKMWDGGHDEQQKETENEQGKGEAQSDEQTAAQEKDKENKQQGEDGENDEEQEETDDEEAPEDEAEAVGREDMDVTDPHANEEDALDLPDEMQLDGDDMDKDEGGESDDGLDDGLDDDLPDLPEEEQKGDGGEDFKNDEAEQPADEEGDQEAEEGAEEQEMQEAEEEDTNAPGEEEPEEPEQDNNVMTQPDETEHAGDEVAPSEAVNGGLGTDQDQNQEKGSSGNAQQQDGSTDPSAEKKQQTGATQDSEENDRARDAGGDTDSKPEDPQLQAFKKMGDILEQWHRRQKEILEASKQEEDEAEKQLPEDADMADADFEHLADQDDVADTQALGQASEEQAQALDQNKGVESDVKPTENDILPDVSEEQQDVPENHLEDEMQVERGGVPSDEQKPGAMIPGGAPSQERTDAQAQQELEEELDEVDAHLAAIHLSSSLPPLTPRDEAQRLWSQYESATNDLSLSLTEQLRLILAPTLATKLRGDFRTGKRLNIKRIIPYIASQYKRDKIWMRRSIPSKRNYQIMLAVDDSKSMLESGSGQLAFETLALVAKSLSMLEAGDLCVLGFGNEEHVRVAHDFGRPFSSEAGSQVFQHFSYQQTGTNVRKLIADSIALFREARLKGSPGGSNADLWQLELIISDGICEDHATIQRLVRQAQEERIMIVFIIVDAVKGSSILDLSQASFEPDGTGEMKLKMKRYLEGFPFPYYLVVRDVRELPAVLATALKQWFAEVVDVSS